MLLLTTLFSAAFLAPAYAADTSGCSQRLETTKGAATANGGVEVIYDRAPRENCWNADQASLRISYPVAQNARVSFWVSLNGTAQTLDAAVTCTGQSSLYAKDTRNERPQTCVATLTLPTRAGRQELELAPIVNGSFDTAGYGQNARISF